MADIAGLGADCLDCKRKDYLPIECTICNEFRCSNCAQRHVQDKHSHNNDKDNNVNTAIPENKNEIDVIEHTLQQKKRAEAQEDAAIAQRFDKAAQKRTKIESLQHKSALPNPSSSVSASASKSSKTEQLVRAMKLKKLAKGHASTPMTERLYIECILPHVQEEVEGGVELKTAAVFVNKSNSVSLAIDSIASTLHITNNNASPNAPQLVLQNDHGEEFDLHEIIGKLCHNGARVRLTYI